MDRALDKVFTSRPVNAMQKVRPFYTPLVRMPGNPNDPDYSRQQLAKGKSWIFVIVLLLAGAIAFMGPLKGLFQIQETFPGCNDGTPHDTCSATKPYYCFDGRLSVNVETCGCPPGERAYEFKCIPYVQCIDGTLEPDCSPQKPYQCLNGNLVLKASVCGCPGALEIDGDYCKTPKI
jgi:hypothetical protein